jgi:hypothetical protein
MKLFAVEDENTKQVVSGYGQKELRYKIVEGPKGPMVDMHGSLIKSDVYYFVQDKVGQRAQSYMHVYPVSFFAPYIADVTSDLAVNLSASYKNTEGFIQYIVETVNKRRDTFIKKQDEGLIEFIDLPYLFTVGSDVYCQAGGQLIGGRVQSVTYHASFFDGVYALVSVSVYHTLLGEIQKGKTNFRIDSFDNFEKISDLPVKLLTPAAREIMEKRGRMFERLAQGSAYVSYMGNIVQKSWYGNKSYRADGRVMIDPRTFQRIDSNTFDSVRRQSGIILENKESSNHIDTDGDADSMKVAPDELYSCWPFVWGFSFRAKQWGEMAISNMTEIMWADNAFDQLVLPDREKSLIMTLVKHNGKSFADIIDGKGGGCIFMLHGEPGQGKTLTAEAVAEILHRPLYSVSIGELGTNPDQLEKRLREILDIASVWNAVLLLDEADIYLEQRDEKDIVRNAMVGVFLRLLEYHQGVLFLTTNRVKNIDTAFYSRISIALRFQKATTDKLVRIWTNLLAAANIKLDPTEIERLALHDINGRQIKNVIRLSQTLALESGKNITYSDIVSVIDDTTAFEKQMRE